MKLNLKTALATLTLGAALTSLRADAELLVAKMEAR